MNETKPPVPPGQSPQPTPATDITYQVMPNSNNSSSGQMTSTTSAPHGNSVSGGGGSKVVYIVIAVIVLLLLGGLAYYFLGNKKEVAPPEQSTSRLPKAFMVDNFAKDVCDDEATCGESADPDNDGLNNYQEFVAGTKPTLADTDSDGLADGDEVSVYSTNPKNNYTDTRAVASQNGFNDGVSIKNGYDPTTPGDKFTETRLATIAAKISQNQLHAPTTTTLNVKANGVPNQTVPPQ